MGMTPDQIEEFLDNLNEKESFRDALCDNPIAVLESYGVDVSEVSVPSEVELPEIGDVNRNRDAYRDALFPPDEHFFFRPIFRLQASGD